MDFLLNQKGFVIIAVDGNCTAGKTALVEHLSEIYDVIFSTSQSPERPKSLTLPK